MVSIQGSSEYRQTSLLLQSADQICWRGVRRVDGAPVLLRRLSSGVSDLPTYLRREQAWANALGSPPVLPVLAIESSGEGPILVLEDPGVVRLQGVPAPLAPARWIELGIALCAAIAPLHDSGVLHLDLRPEHVWIAGDSTIRLTGMGNAMRLSSEALLSRMLPGATAYSAPERTGRINRRVDLRTDLYAVGVILYELITGNLPFGGEDGLAVLHAHLTRLPDAPYLAANAPRVLSDITMKLLEKNQADRYQTIHSLRADLEEAARRERAGGTALKERIELGTLDREAILRVSDRLYGRDTEITALMTAFDRVAAGGCGVSLVSGPSGVGKTALNTRIAELTRARGAHFLSGKAEQFRVGGPLAPVRDALAPHLERVLSASDSGPVHQHLKAAIGSNGRVLTRAMPLFQRLTGLVPDGAPASAERGRLEQALVRVMGALASAPHPLVIALEDLQWADSATLRWLAALAASPDGAHILVIGTLRDGEVGPDHPLRGAVKQAREWGARVEEIPLAPLGAASVEALVADSMNRPAGEIRGVAEQIFQRTSGNPFFARVLLNQLARTGVLTFDPETASWRTEGTLLGDPADLASLVLAEFQALPAEVRQVLHIAACAVRFDVPTIAAAGSFRPGDVVRWLGQAIKRGLITVIDDPAGYTFVHDAIQQQAYLSIPVDEKARWHLRLGRLLRDACTASDEAERRVFDVVHHLSRARNLIEDRDELVDVARWSLRACRRARASCAFPEGFQYAVGGLEMLGEDAWDEAHSLAFELHLEVARCARLADDLGRATEALAVLALHAVTPEDHFRLCELRIRQGVALSDNEAAVSAGLEGLAALGVVLPREPEAVKALLDEQYSVVARIVAETPHARLIDPPEMTDERTQWVCGLLNELLPAVNFAGPDFYALCSTMHVRLSLEHGLTASSLYGYIVYASRLSTSAETFDHACQIGEVALEIARRRPMNDDCQLLFALGAYVHFIRPLRDAQDYLEQSLTAGLQTGSWLFLSYACTHLLMLRLSLGDPLEEVQRTAERYVALMRRTGVTSSAQSQRVSLQFARCLRGFTLTPTSLSDASLDEDLFASELPANSFAALWLQSTRLQRLCLVGQYKQAVDLLGGGLEEVGFRHGFHFATEVSFYAPLALLGRLRELDASDPTVADLRERVDVHRTLLARWAARSPDTFRHKLLLIDAEMLSVDGKPYAAVAAYEEAIAEAKRNGFVDHRGIACDLAARHAERQGQVELGRASLERAHHSFTAWGAVHLAQSVGNRLERPESAGGSADALDLDTLFAASRALSAEVEIGALLRKVIDILVVDAGADRASLILRDESGMRLLASFRAGSGARTWTEYRVELDLATAPLAIVQRVFDTGETVILDDPTEAASGLSPAPRSLLCMGLQHQSLRQAVLVLENHMTAGLFTPARLKVLQLLSSQVAISMDKAMAYQSLELAREQAEHASQAKSQFLMRMSHELRTPLNAVLGYTELVMEDCTDEVARADLSKVLQAAGNLVDLVEDVLDLSRIETGKLEISCCSFDLTELLTEVVHTMQPVIRRNGNRLDRDIDPALGTVRSDPVRVRQILANLLTNAGKFTSEGTVSLRARLDIPTDAVYIEVEDTGIGMTDHEVQHIFEAFHQVDESTNRRFGGLGLGLAITRDLCALLGGSVLVSSAPGKGSRFTVVLPRNPPMA